MDIKRILKIVAGALAGLMAFGSVRMFFEDGQQAIHLIIGATFVLLTVVIFRSIITDLKNEARGASNSAAKLDQTLPTTDDDKVQESKLDVEP